MGAPREHPARDERLTQQRHVWSVAALVSAAALLASCTSSSEVPSATDSAGATGLPDGERARVDRVVDGDTLIVDGNRVRLIGMDAPESVKPNSPVECYGPEASEELARLLPRRTSVLLEYDQDRLDPYDRVLAYVWLTDPPRLINVELVRDGFATVATYPPNVAHLDDLKAAERSARAARRGLWAKCP